MSNICGMDLSLSGTGIVILNKKNEILEQILISTKPILCIEERINFIYKKIKKLLSKHKVGKVNIEGLAFGLRGQRSLELSGLHYFIRVWLHNSKIPFITTPPTTLKKFVTGKGNSKKNLILLSVYKKWKISFDDDNLADAYCLARYLSIENNNKSL